MIGSRQKILITGASGFIGRNLIHALVVEGHEIATLSRRRQASPKGATEFVVDGSYSSIENAILEFKPELVIHLATHYLAQHRAEDLDAMIDGNISFGVKLLEAMSRNGISALINTGTMFQHYANAEYNPINLYAAMKQAFEDLVRHYVAVSKLKVLHLKISDSYGSNDGRMKVYHFLKRATETGERIEFSPGEQLVDPVHVDDIIAAYTTAIQRFDQLVRDQKEATYRISSGTPVSLRQLAALFEEASGKKLDIAWGAKPYRDREVMEPNTRFDWIPGWKPKISLKEGIKRLLSGT